MAESDWQPLPTPMWPAPAAWTDAGEFMLSGIYAGWRTDMGGPREERPP